MAIPFRMPIDDNIKHLMKTVLMILSQTRVEEVSDETTELIDCMDNLHAKLCSEFERRNRASKIDCRLRDTLILLKCELEEKYPRPEPSICDDCKSATIAKDEIDNQLKLERRFHHHNHSHHPDREETTRKNEKTDDSAWWLPMSLRRSLWTVLPVLCVLGWHYLETSLCIV